MADPVWTFCRRENNFRLPEFEPRNLHSVASSLYRVRYPTFCIYYILEMRKIAETCQQNGEGFITDLTEMHITKFQW